jgi:hypothetical protein
MGLDRIGLGLAWAVLTAAAGCVGEGQAGSADGPVTKGGDDRTGAYDLVEHFWRPAPNHGTDWTWGSIAAVATDGPDRIFVTAWGDRPVARSGDEQPQGQGSSLRMQNLITVVDRNGNMVENWSQWDSVMTQPHRIAIDPYDPDRHVWVVDLGRPGAHEQVLKFTNDGSHMVLRLRDPLPQLRPAEQRERFPNPGPLDFGQPSVIVFLPDGPTLTQTIQYFTPNGEFETVAVFDRQ